MRIYDIVVAVGVAVALILGGMAYGASEVRVVVDESPAQLGGASNFSSLIVNEHALDEDSRFEGSSNSELFFLDAGNDRIAVGTSSPDQLLHVDGGASATTTAQFGSGANASSNTCFNLNDDAGNVVSAYVSGTSWVIESGACN